MASFLNGFSVNSVFSTINAAAQATTAAAGNIAAAKASVATLRAPVPQASAPQAPVGQNTVTQQGAPNPYAATGAQLTGMSPMLILGLGGLAVVALLMLRRRA